MLSGFWTEGARGVLSQGDAPSWLGWLYRKGSRMTDGAPETKLSHTPLFDLHQELGGKMVPFAGYAMPVQYPAGIVAEHVHTRTAAGLFDVSHMGQAILSGDDAAGMLERVAPGDFQALGTGEMRYSMLLTDDGGIVDDLMVTRLAEADGVSRAAVVVNAARKDVDYALLRAKLPDAGLQVLDKALLALQGPQAVMVLARLAPGVADLNFMSGAAMEVAGIAAYVSRSGYTGEDGYEISVAAADADGLARRLLAEDEVAPIGLGARDTLRLEAGLCLYGHDIDETTTPIEAGLAWAVGKRRRAEGGFPGAARIAAELADGTARRRVGIQPSGRAPAREGTVIKDTDGRRVGRVTSGGHGPSVGGPVAMGYVEAAHKAPGTALLLEIRGKDHAAEVVKLPFVKPNYYRG